MKSLKIASASVAFVLAQLLPASQALAAACPVTVAPGRIFQDTFEPAATDPLASPGPFSIASASGTTQRGNRSIPWVAVYPQTTGPLPMLVFAPGYQVPSAAYRDWIEHLATWGFVAVRTDPVFNILNASSPEATLDVRAVIDDLLVPAALPVAVDASLIASSGHSAGGTIAVRLASIDSRIRAVYALDPVDGNGTQNAPSVAPEAVTPLAIPLGFAGELTDSGSSGGLACAPLAHNYQTFFSAATNAVAAYEWTLRGAAAFDFVTNQDACGINCTFCEEGTLDEAVTHAFMRASAVAFLNTHLLGETDACATLGGSLLPAPVDVRTLSAP